MSFPTTRMSVVAGLSDPDPARAHRSFARVAEVYGKPLYKHVRLRWHRSAEDAADLVQEFLAVCFERDYLARWDPARASFRAFLRTCVDRFVAKDIDASQAQKRGGGARPLSLDFALAEHELAGAAVPDVESVFEREWTRTVFELALASLRAELTGSDREIRLRVFEAHDLADPGAPGSVAQETLAASDPGAPSARPSYKEVAARFGLPVTTVTNHLSFARRELRRHIIETLRELTASEDELRAEVHALLGETL